MSAPPPPPPGMGQQLAAWWARRHALSRVPFWLLTRAMWVLAPCAVLFVICGVLMGWADAYEVLVGITSPADAEPRWAAWPLSIAGWAAMPALVGGAAGYVISAQIERHQQHDFDAVVAELLARTRAQSPQDPGDST